MLQMEVRIASADFKLGSEMLQIEVNMVSVFMLDSKMLQVEEK